MTNLNTATCKCGHTFTATDIRPPLNRVPKGFFGGSVDRSCEAKCPGCGQGYSLYIKQTGQSWRVRSIAYSGEVQETPETTVVVDEETVIETVTVEEETVVDQSELFGLEAPGLKAWLKKNDVPFTPQWGEARLRETALAWLATQPKPEEEKENNDQ